MLLIKTKKVIYINKKQYERIRTLAENQKFNNPDYANQLIVSLCQELENQTTIITNLQNQVKHRPITYPHKCYLVMSKYDLEEQYLFREKYEADLFIYAHDTPSYFQIRTIELFETHKKALLRRDYAFLNRNS